MKIVQVHPGILPIPPNGWGAVEKIIWEYKLSLERQGHTCDILYLNDIDPSKYDVIHIHMANLALEAHQRGMKYYFTCHDHHTYIYGKDSWLYNQNRDAMKYSVKSFVPAKYLVEYFDLPNVVYQTHGVNNQYFEYVDKPFTGHKLLCVANNGIGHDNTHDRKGFGFAIKAAAELGLPITIAGPSNNKNFFNAFDFKYNKLTTLFDISEKELLELYQSHTIFLHLSDLEAGHPNLTLLEAMSCGMPVIATLEDNNELLGLKKSSRNVNRVVEDLKEVILNYEKYKIDSIQTAKEKNWDFIINDIVKNYTPYMDEVLNYIYRITEISYKPSLESSNQFNIDYNNGCKVEILGNVSKKYHISFIDNASNVCLYETELSNNMWAATSIKYFVDYSINVTDLETNITYVNKLDFKDQHIKIVNESPSLGDYIAWVPFVDLFQKKHNCIVDFYTPNKDLFKENYKNLNFYNYNENIDQKYVATYRLGYFDPTDRDLSPTDNRTINLQKTAADILGLDYKDTRAKAVIKNKTRPLNEKYVCISTASTAGAKHWQYDGGWQKTVDYLNSLGYKVVVIQKEPLNYMDLKQLNNVLHPKTNTLDEAINWLFNCEFFIGLGSGISWLTWSLNKKVVLISGFSKKFAEFETPYRIINESVCNGCWNNQNHKFNPGDWNWCPEHKNTIRQFECTKQISFDMVKEQIDRVIQEL
jgi:autotransporter strand-loop-strand O-heptosyltransferase